MDFIDILKIPQLDKIDGINNYAEPYFGLKSLVLDLTYNEHKPNNGSPTRYNRQVPLWKATIASRNLKNDELQKAKAFINLMLSKAIPFKIYAHNFHLAAPETITVKAVIDLKNLELDATQNLNVGYYFTSYFEKKFRLHQVLASEINQNKRAQIFFEPALPVGSSLKEHKTIQLKDPFALMRINYKTIRIQESNNNLSKITFEGSSI